eukprot:9620-Heterococcus_DN1.PRE.3
MAQFGSKIEVGVFDMSRLPVRWDKLEIERVQQTMEAIEGSLEEQIEQLTQAKKSTADAVDAEHGHTEEEAPRLPRAVIAPEGYSLYVQLIDLTLPVSWHVINEYNNELVINGTGFALTPGNYSVRTLVSTLSTLLAPDISVSFDTITLKLTLTALFPLTVSGSLCSVLGIVPGSTGLSLSSQHTVDLTGQNSVYVLSDFSTSNNNIDTRGNSSVFCRIPVTAAPMQVLQHEDYQGLSGLLLDTDTLMSVHLKLEDEEYRPLLCTLHWEATLQIQFVYTGRMHMAYERPLGLIAA